eukprot:3333574-Alexandrium_andersonii.AAC.1
MAETAVGRQSRPGFEAVAHRAGWQVIAPPGHRPSGRFGGVALAVRADKYALVRSKHSSSAHVDWLRADLEGAAAPVSCIAVYRHRTAGAWWPEVAEAVTE